MTMFNGQHYILTLGNAFKDFSRTKKLGSKPFKVSKFVEKPLHAGGHFKLVWILKSVKSS